VSLAERFREAISNRPPEHAGDYLHVTASFGVATLHDRDESPMDLLNRADRALYEAKSHGGDTVKTINSGPEPAPYGTVEDRKHPG
jgi:diguanylate cyclase (GGDEF)-like protein